MKEISISLMHHNDRSHEIIQPVLDAFEKEFHIHVNLSILNWSTGYTELTREAIYGRGPDISEIGSTWVSSLTSMNSLRPFTPRDVMQMGQPEAFIPAAWQTCLLKDDARVWAIPYTGNIYLINYRKDLFQKAGIDPLSAFQSHAKIEETVRQLAQSGVPMPIVLPEDRYALLHAMTSWIWEQGGDFCTSDGKQVLFGQPESILAIRAYFGLLRSIAPATLPLASSRPRSIELFCNAETALHFYDLTIKFLQPEMLPEVRENLGVLPFPKPYFMGGTNLVIWQHSPRVEAAVALVQYLTSSTPMAQVAVPYGMLPPRLSVMKTPEFLSDPFLKNLGDVTTGGRSYPSVKAWGMIEKRFVDALFDIRTIILADPWANIDELIQKRIVPLADRLNVGLMQ